MKQLIWIQILLSFILIPSVFAENTASDISDAPDVQPPALMENSPADAMPEKPPVEKKHESKETDPQTVSILPEAQVSVIPAHHEPAPIPPPSPATISNQDENEAFKPVETTNSPAPVVWMESEEDDRTEYAIIVEKQTQTLYLYAFGSSLGAQVHEKFRMKCSTGKNAGAKTRDGDAKTPEGVYFFVKEFNEEELAPIYGFKAFPTDYPNLLDRAANYTGNAIWLHGTNKPLKDRDSNGCIVLENENIKKIIPYIRLNHTPIIVVKKLSFGEDPETRDTVRQFLANWTAALEKGTYHDFLAHYDPEYLPDIAWWREWRTIRKKTRGMTVGTTGLMIFKHDDIFTAVFHQKLRTPSGRQIPAGIRKLFISNKSGQMTIIGDTFQNSTPVNERENLFAAAFPKIGDERPAPEIEAVVKSWLKAWSSKDIEAYGGYYASDFKSQNMNRDAWLAYKDQLNKKYDFIRVSGSEIRVKAQNDRCIVSFIQDYQSPNFKALGKKELIMKNENGAWKIFRETWKKL